MDDNQVQFQNQGPQAPQQQDSNGSGMIGWIMKISKGKIQNEKQAQTVLVVFVIVILAISFFISFDGGTEEQTNLEIPFEEGQF